jgi:predicted RNase H-like HicB family nuclease
MSRYLVIIEQGTSSFGAYVPDLPGCVAVGSSREEVKELIQEALTAHLEDMRRTGQDIPQPTSVPEYVETDAA